MSKTTTTAKPRETRKGKTDKYGMTAADWARLDAMTDAEVLRRRPTRAARNARQHQAAAFEAARLAFADPRAIDRLDLDETSEDRMLLTGLANDVLLTVCFAERGRRIRIIAAERQRNVSKTTTTARPRETRKGKTDEYE